MHQLLEKNEQLSGTHGGTKYVVGECLGSGAQGEVYRAKGDGHEVALKWYWKQMATDEQRRILEKLVSQGRPDERFLWPEDLVTSSKRPGYGYVMPLREPRFKSITMLLSGRVSPRYRKLTEAAFDLVDAFYQLHSKGYSYRDINDGGVFFDFDAGKVLICDNDNVYFDGASTAGVKGKLRWMAPEIVRGDAVPSWNTDLFSLAVLLFFMYVVSHPLEGRLESDIHCFDTRAMNKLYGFHPVFIFDPTNDSNLPDPHRHKNALKLWPNYPRSFRQLFEKSFTSGLHDPDHGRVGEYEWRRGLSELRDSLYRCRSCGEDLFYDRETVGSGAAIACPDCHKPLVVPARMKISPGENVVVLDVGTQLFEHHLRLDKRFVFDKVLAEVVAHPTNPDVLGIRNLTQDTWMLINTEDERKEVPPGKSAAIASTKEIRFGQTTGVLRS